MPHITRVHGDSSGETHLSTVRLDLQPDDSGVSFANIPIEPSMMYVHYPAGDREIISGFHCAPQRQFVMSIQGSFEVRTTTGETKLFVPGDWLLADDVGSNGHITKGLGSDERINVVIAVSDDWTLPVA